MKNFYLLMAAVLIAICSSPSAQAQNGVGNGGDPLRNMYEQAQKSAVDLVSQVVPCAFRADVAPAVRDWIIKNQTAYAQDLRTTQMKWIVDLQGTCAYTALTASSNIYLSYNECRDSTHSFEDAIFTLLHETVHHFNVPDETFADAVARAILYGTYPMNSCPTSGTPFDSSFCQGTQMTQQDAIARFSPGSTQTELNRSIEWSIRSRDCQTLTGCSQWSDGGASFGHYTGYGFTSASSISSGLAIDGGNSLFVVLKIVSDQLKSGSELRYQFANLKFSSNNYYHYIRIDGSHIDSLPNDFVETKLTNRCLWLKSKATFDYGNGVTREVEVVFHGNH